MPIDRSVLAAFGAAGLILLAGAVTVQSQGKKDMPFGGKEDVAFAKQLWSTLKAAKLVGPNRINDQVRQPARRGGQSVTMKRGDPTPYQWQPLLRFPQQQSSPTFGIHRENPGLVLWDWKLSTS